VRLAAATVFLALALVLAGCMGDDDSGGEAAPQTVTVTRTVGGGTAAAPSPGGDLFARIPDLVDRLDRSVVSIQVETAQGGAEGSGVIYDGDGLIVTNYHVVADGEQVSDQIRVVLASGRELDAEVEAFDKLADLAVLRVDQKGLPAATFAGSLPRVGELAIALGNPAGFEQSVSAGIVSGLHRAIPSGGQTPALVDLIQTDAAISPGNSGGALVNGDGEVIGINVAYIPPEQRAVSIGFAIPSPVAKDVVTQLIETGEVKRAFLGLQPLQITPDVAQSFGLGVEEGAGVESVTEGAAADRAGIRGGDVIVELGGEPVKTVEDLFSQLRRFRPGQKVAVTIVRDGDERDVQVTLDERPPDE
jgi:S1-C subfamily serine protease